MATAKKLPSGNYRVRVFAGYNDENKPVYKSFTAPTKKQAEFEAAEYLMGANKKQEKNGRITLKDAAEEYIEVRKNVLSPWTVNGYRRIIHNGLGKLANMQVSDIDELTLQRHINQFAAAHSPKTVRNVNSFIQSVIKKQNKYAKFDINLPAKTKPKITIPTDEEVRMALKYTEGTEMWLVIALCAMLGLRRGEICALTWGDIRGGKVDINKAVATNEHQEQVIKQPKTYAGYRTLDLPNSIVAYLKKARTSTTKDTDPLVSLSAQAVTKRWEVICNKLGFKCRFYDLRHYNASTMLEIGIPDLYAMERMGHSTTHMLKTVYQHVKDKKRAQTDILITEKMNLLNEANDTRPE